MFARWLDDLHGRFAERIVAIDARVAEDWGRLNTAATRNTVDSLIAASARVHSLIVVTRNTNDFEGCGVPLLNPWQPQDDPASWTCTRRGAQPAVAVARLVAQRFTN